jgi:hypothetical protein
MLPHVFAESISCEELVELSEWFRLREEQREKELKKAKAQRPARSAAPTFKRR